MKNQIFKRTKEDYVVQLKNDLASYYSYNEYLIDKFIQLFPLNEVNF
jgi:ribosomal RNA methyltransferase Nop2